MKRLSFLLCLMSIISLSACDTTKTPTETSSSNAKLNISVGDDRAEETQNSTINIQVKETEAQQ